jgi:uncharacterized membrane protein YdbT with pleckstrin-like domain
VEQGLISPQGQPQQQQQNKEEEEEQQQQQQVAVANGQQQQQQTAAKELVVAAAAGAGVKAGTPAKVPAAARSSRLATLAPGQQQQQRPGRLPEFSLEAPPDALPVPT